MDEFKMKQQAPYIRHKDYDHEDVDAEFTSDGTLAIVANVLVSVGAFSLLMFAIVVLMQIPSEWVEVVLLAVKGTV